MRSVLVLLSVVWANCCFGSELIQAWEYALSNSSEIQAASEKRNADYEAKAQSLAHLLPSLRGNTYYQEQPQNNADDSAMQGWGIELTQALLNVTKWHQYKKGTTRSMIADLELQDHRHQLLTKVTQVYFDTLQSKKDLELIKKTRESMAAQVVQTEALYKKGAGTIIDFYDAQSAYEAICAEEIAIHNKLKIGLGQLSSMTGFPYRTLQQGNIVMRAVDVSTFEYWKQKVLSGNFALQVKMELVKEADYDVKAVKSQHLPTIDLNLGYRDNIHKRNVAGSGGVRYSTRGNYIDVRMTVPLFNGGAMTSQTRQSVASREFLRHEYDNAIENTLLDMERLFLDVKSSQYQAKAFTQLCETNNTKLEATRIGLTAGVRTQIDLINAERDYLEAQRKLAEAQYQFASSYVTLQILSGEIELLKIQSIMN
ncbi:TolC family protein [Thiopseudomonas denitrificans]|uniref:Outer membrane protein TolC n=1 Tax=Thiopseudomonas denitrificans TaxID=1501432 RepID=A0A4R6U5M5_9GAMM|nr:TolC family protein [Thiopseudomonas denitrificans]TDQ39929.1 outer membrane protein TolC [Thiopseudomonas denitrificans]